MDANYIWLDAYLCKCSSPIWLFDYDVHDTFYPMIFANIAYIETTEKYEPFGSTIYKVFFCNNDRKSISVIKEYKTHVIANRNNH